MYATTWINLEDIILNGMISLSQKVKYCMIPLNSVPRVVTFLETEVEWWVPETAWRVNEELLLSECGDSVRENEKTFWKWMVVMFSQQRESNNVIELYTGKNHQFYVMYILPQ